MTSPLALPLGVTENAVKVHPVVLFSICDAYIRRNEEQDRVIGTLLGTIADGIVEIKSCFAVPHSESNEQVAVDVQQHQTMCSLHSRVNPLENVVGWFSTGSDVSGSDALIQSFYSNETANPVHLTLDTNMVDGHMRSRAYVSRTLSIDGRELAREFQEIPCEVLTAETERVSGHVLAHEAIENVQARESELGGISMSLAKLEAALGEAKKYVDDVIAGRKPADVTLGRALSDALTTVPRFSPEDLKKLMSDHQHDILLSMYLANLVKAHISLADRLGTMQLPLV